MRKICAMILTLVFMCSSFTVLANTNEEYVWSEWTDNNVFTALSVGLIDELDVRDVRKPVAREAFCEMIYNLMLFTDYFNNFYDEQTKGGTEPLPPFAKRPFDDCNSDAVYTLYNHNIVEGKSATAFAPQDTLTREEAATIIARMTDIVSPLPATEVYYSFDDADDISYWARSAIQKISNAGIMIGVGDNRFAPKDAYTTEEAIATVLRVWDVYAANNIVHFSMREDDDGDEENGKLPKALLPAYHKIEAGNLGYKKMERYIYIINFAINDRKISESDVVQEYTMVCNERFYGDEHINIKVVSDGTGILTYMFVDEKTCLITEKEIVNLTSEQVELVLNVFEDNQFWALPPKHPDERYGYDGAYYFIEGIHGDQYNIIAMWCPDKSHEIRKIYETTKMLFNSWKK